MGSIDVRRQRAALLYQFSKVGSKYGLSFSSQEVLPHRIIGLDGIQQTLLVFEVADTEFDWYLIHLKEVKACTLKKVYRNIDADEFSRQPLDFYLEAIALEFSYKTGKPSMAVPFYNKVQNSLEETAELNYKARKWEIMLSKMLTKEIKRA